MQLDVVVGFFLLGMVAQLLKAPIKMPKALRFVAMQSTPHVNKNALTIK